MKTPEGPWEEGAVAVSDASFSAEPNPELRRLWAKYRFPAGGAPFAGSPAEVRLVETCSRYAQYVLYPERFEHKQREQNPFTGKSEIVGDGENYFGADRRKSSSSDSTRRQLHNEIALMVVGQQRSGMGFEQADEIARFAVEVYQKFGGQQ